MKNRRPQQVSKYENSYGVEVSPSDNFGGLIRNPDELIRKDKFGYERIYANATVMAEAQSLFGPITYAPIVVTGYDPDANDLFTECINSLPNFPEAKEQLLHAYIKGSRLVEMIWGVTQCMGTDLAAPIDFEPHNERRFAKDVAGNTWMTQDGYWGSQSRQNYIVLNREGKAIWVHPDKIIWHTYADGDGTYGYGHGVGLKLYPYVQAYNQLVKSGIDYTQRFAQPWRILYLAQDYMDRVTGSGTDLDTRFQEELQILERMIGGNAAVTMDGNRYEMMAPNSMSDSANLFNTLFVFLTDQIRLFMTGETVTNTSDSAGGGSLAKAQVAVTTSMARRKRLGVKLADTLTRQLLWPLARANRAITGPLNVRSGRIEIQQPEVTQEFQLEAAMKLPVEVLKEDLYHLSGTTPPTPQQIANNETVVPSSSGGSPGLFDSF